MNMKKILLSLLFVFSFFFILQNQVVHAEGFGVKVDFGEQNDMSSSLKTFLFIGVLSLAPFFVMMLTPFPYIIIILGMVRNGIGTNAIPPTQVLVSVALFFTIFIMTPVIKEVHKDAYEPYKNQEITFEEAIAKGQKPIKEFMIKNTDEKDLLSLLKVKKEKKPKNPEELSFWTVVPAYALTSLNDALEKGAFLALGFIVLDLMVGAVLMFLGMMMLPPNIVSMPIKVIIFVGLGGFRTLMELIVSSINT